MKNIFLTLGFIIFIIPAFSQQQTAADFIQQISQQEAKSHENMFKLGNSKLGDNYDLKYHRLNWDIDPDTCFIKGCITSYFTSLATMSQMEFELNQALIIDSIKYHNSNLSYSHPDNTFTMYFTTSIPAGVLDSVSVYYHGKPDPGGFGSFIQNQHNGYPIVWTLSEPFGAPDWWPCKNSLSDKIDSIDVFVTTPKPNKVGSNGKLISVTTAGSDNIYHWKHRHPVATYLIGVAVTNYAVYSDFAPLQHGTVEILNYVYPEDSVYARQNTPLLIPIMHLYDSLFYDYPYMNEKYGHAQFSWGGGMEHQTMTFIVNYGQDLMAHELSHQWFGDKVTCGSWHDIWINEGFATFCTGLTFYFLDNNTSWHNWKTSNINYITSVSNGSVYCYDTTSVGSIFDGRLSYSKGALVLNMLRLKIGDSAMFACMKNFITDPQLAYKSAKTSDFKYHAEQSSGIDLTEFFNDWIYHEGYPVYHINNTVSADSSVNVFISQTQSDPSVDFFELPVPMKFSDGIHDTLIILDNTSNYQSFYVHLNFFPTQITFDPENELIAVLDTCIVNVLNEKQALNDLSVFPNPSNEFLYIHYRTQKIKKVELFDLNGKIIREIFSANSDSSKYNISGFNSGLYFVKVTTENNVVIKRIVKL